MRCLPIDVLECPDQVIRREGYLATQILNGNWCIVASIQQKAGETNLLMRVQAHRRFLPAESGHCGYYSIFPRDAQRVEEEGQGNRIKSKSVSCVPKAGSIRQVGLRSAVNKAEWSATLRVPPQHFCQMVSPSGRDKRQIILMRLPCSERVSRAKRDGGEVKWDISIP